MFTGVGDIVKSKDEFKDPTNSHSKDQWKKIQENESTMFVGIDE
jgi:hypothetical protein